MLLIPQIFQFTNQTVRVSHFLTTLQNVRKATDHPNRCHLRPLRIQFAFNVKLNIKLFNKMSWIRIIFWIT